MTRHKSIIKELAREIYGEESANKLWRRVEFIGDIALIRTPLGINPYELKSLAEALLEKFRYIKSVWAALPGISGDYRLRQCIWLAGEYKSETIYREHGCIFKIDINKVYISPSLNYEHIRVARLVQPGEVVVNMFAGAGLFSIIIAKYAKPIKVYSIDINPDAYRYVVENIKLNRVEDTVVPILGDAGKIIEESLQGTATRVLMPYPELALKYLNYALLALENGKGWIHLYLHLKVHKGENWKSKAAETTTSKLKELGVNDFEIAYTRRIRTVGPRFFQVVVDIHTSIR